MLGRLGSALLIGSLLRGAQAMAQPAPFDFGPSGPTTFFATRGCGGGGTSAGSLPVLSPPPFDLMIGGPMMGWAPLPIPPGVINLSDDQIDQLSRLKDNTSEKTAPIMTTLRSLEHNRRIALSEPELNTGEIAKLSANISTQKQILDTVMADTMLKVAQTLTPEQRKKIKLDMQRHEIGQFADRQTEHSHDNIEHR
jgi:Spy/CpxP family protein refolding chaperone